MKIHRIVQMLGATTSTGKLADDMYDLNYKYYYSEAEGRDIPISHMDFQHLVRAFVKQNDEDVRTNTQEGKYDDLKKQNEDLVSANKEWARQYDIWKEKAMNMVEKSSYQVMWDNCQELQKKLDQEVRIDTQEGKVVELENTLKGTIKANNELIQLNKQLKDSLRQVNLTPTVSTQAYDVAWYNNQELKKQVEHWKKTAESNFIQSVKDCEDKDTWAKKYDNEVKESEFWKNRYHDFISVDSFKASAKGCNYVFSEIPNNCDGQRFTDDMKQYLNKDSYKLRVRGQYLDEETKRIEGWRKYEAGQPIDKSKCLRVYIDKK
jgi:hypothetical protein